jgi:3-methylcrotonyl-CoA carboxylase beta subunit
VDREKYRSKRSLLIMQLNTPKIDFDFSNIEEPLYDPEELNYIVSPDLKKTFDARSVLARILDGSKF